MTSREQLYVLQTIKAMKEKIARDAIESDSDSEIQAPTNRGNKLKQKAKFVREGKLGPPTGPSVYKQEVEHAGYRRSIISRNPPLVDEDGYDIDSDDDEERVQDAITAAAESDPYSSLRLEHLLAPLTSVTELPTHPTLSRPFTSTALSSLANQGCDLMHKENAALAKVRPLLSKLTGDHTWASCEMFLGSSDSEYFDDRYMSRLYKRREKESEEHRGDARTNGTGRMEIWEKLRVVKNPLFASSRSGDRDSGDEDAHMTDNEDTKEPVVFSQPGAEFPGATAPPVLSQHGPRSSGQSVATNGNQPPREVAHTNGDAESTQTSKTTGKELDSGPIPGDEEYHVSGGSNGDVDMDCDAVPTLSAELQMNEMPFLAAGIADDLFVHPIFLAPKTAHPDRDQGLPEQEAEDVRRLLQLYVQKQEEVCRSTRKLYEGLLKADRQRKTVLGWAKSEAHCGPNRDMSDGEDWYDQDEWGLTEDLKKGQDEEEEDTTQTQKKTRNRGK